MPHRRSSTIAPTSRGQWVRRSGMSFECNATMYTQPLGESRESACERNRSTTSRPVGPPAQHSSCNGDGGNCSRYLHIAGWSFGRDIRGIEEEDIDGVCQSRQKRPGQVAIDAVRRCRERLARSSRAFTSMGIDIGRETEDREMRTQQLDEKRRDHATATAHFQTQQWRLREESLQARAGLAPRYLQVQLQRVQQQETVLRGLVHTRFLLDSQGPCWCLHSSRPYFDYRIPIDECNEESRFDRCIKCRSLSHDWRYFHAQTVATSIDEKTEQSQPIFALYMKRSPCRSPRCSCSTLALLCTGHVAHRARHSNDHKAGEESPDEGGKRPWKAELTTCSAVASTARSWPACDSSAGDSLIA
jgi:hypothetical protein